MNGEKQAWRLPRLIQFMKDTYCINDNKNTYGKQEGSGGEQAGPFTDRAIPHNSKCRYGERGAADAVPQLPERCLSRKAGIVRCCHRNLVSLGSV